MNQFEISSLEETRQFAEDLAKLLAGKTITITLDGDLGAGKTTWTKALGKALGIQATINSPTFTIMKNYKLPDGTPFYHLDAYRLEGAHQDLGFEECFDEGIAVVEWAQYMPEQIPTDHISISFQEGIGERRTVQLEGTGLVSKEIVEAYVCSH